jgi:hypothetical protein
MFVSKGQILSYQTCCWIGGVGIAANAFPWIAQSNQQM